MGQEADASLGMGLYALLEITRHYRRLLGITTDYQALLQITNQYYLFQYPEHCHNASCPSFIFTITKKCFCHTHVRFSQHLGSHSHRGLTLTVSSLMLLQILGSLPVQLFMLLHVENFYSEIGMVNAHTAFSDRCCYQVGVWTRANTGSYRALMHTSQNRSASSYTGELLLLTLSMGMVQRVTAQFNSHGNCVELKW